MTITVFDTRVARTPVHKKPTFIEVARKARIVRTRIMMVRSELRDIDNLLTDLQILIVELEEVTQQ